MSPLQGRWVVEVTFPFVGASPYAILFDPIGVMSCPERAIYPNAGASPYAMILDPVGVTQCPNDRWGYECPVGAI